MPLVARSLVHLRRPSLHDHDVKFYATLFGGGESLNTR